MSAKAKTVACATFMGVIFIGVLLVRIFCGGTAAQLEQTFKGGPPFQESPREKRQASGKAQVNVLAGNDTFGTDTLATDIKNQTIANAITKGSNEACNAVIESFYF